MSSHLEFSKQAFHCYEVLKEHIVDPNSYEADCATSWAKDRAHQQDNALPEQVELEQVEDARSYLLHYIRDTYTPGEAEYWDNKAALDALRLCIIVDRANALYLMKLDRNDPECPRGFPWVERDKLTPEMKWKDTQMTRPSITHKYRAFAEAHGADEAYLTELNELLKTQLPGWMATSM